MDLGEDRAVERPEAPALGKAQVFRELELAEVAQHLLRAAQSLLEARGSGTERPGRAREELARCRQEALALLVPVGGSECAHERHGLPWAKAVTLHCAEDRLLAGRAQPDQRVGQRRPYLAGVDLAHGSRREPMRDGQPLLDPVRLLVKDSRDRLLAEAFVLPQRGHYPGLVHGRERARRRVREEEESLCLVGLEPVLDHDGHALRPGPAPALQALEPVDYLVGQLPPDWHDPQRELLGLLPWVEGPAPALAKRGEARPQPLHFDPLHRAGTHCSARTRRVRNGTLRVRPHVVLALLGGYSRGRVRSPKVRPIRPARSSSQGSGAGAALGSASTWW